LINNFKSIENTKDVVLTLGCRVLWEH